jgi:SAM-dependent methyltransferase
MDPLFWEVHRDLPREAPGSEAETLRALAMTGVRGPLRVLDIGCGPGASAEVLLAALPEAEVTGVDLHAPFLRAAEARCARFDARFRAVEADMAALPFAPGAFDLLWCEGAAYILGVERALTLWRPLVGAAGRIAFTDAVWLTGAPSAAARGCWQEYPGMTDLEGLRAIVARTGWRLLGDFVLGEAAWEAYYGPLGARLALLEAEHGADHPVLAEHRREIALRREHGAEYGYAFFVAEAA